MSSEPDESFIAAIHGVSTRDGQIAREKIANLSLQDFSHGPDLWVRLRAMRYLSAVLTGALLLASSSAFAQGKPRIDRIRLPGAPPAAGADAAAPVADAGIAATANVGETPNGEKSRAEYIKSTRQKIRQIVDPKNGKNNDIRTMVGKHWRHALRLIRIRNLAEAANDGVIVARANAQLKRIDDMFYTSLKLLNKSVTADGGAK